MPAETVTGVMPGLNRIRFGGAGSRLLLQRRNRRRRNRRARS